MRMGRNLHQQQKREQKGSNTRANKNRVAKTKIMEKIAVLNSGRGEVAEAEIRNRFRSKK